MHKLTTQLRPKCSNSMQQLKVYLTQVIRQLLPLPWVSLRMVQPMVPREIPKELTEAMEKESRAKVPVANLEEMLTLLASATTIGRPLMNLLIVDRIE